MHLGQLIVKKLLYISSVWAGQCATGRMCCRVAKTAKIIHLLTIFVRKWSNFMTLMRVLQLVPFLFDLRPHNA
jgi:hypothetical protein